MAIILEKGCKINLEKKNSLGEISVNLNWSKKKKVLFFSVSNPIDLDICCLYELKNGTIGSIQAVGRNFGILTDAPYISLDADDRTGERKEGETLKINGNKISEIKRILVFADMYDGVINWKDADGIVTIKYPENDDIIIKLDEFNSKDRICALALFENQNGETFSVEKIIKFYPNCSDMDKDFNWGLTWFSASK